MLCSPPVCCFVHACALSLGFQAVAFIQIKHGRRAQVLFSRNLVSPHPQEKRMGAHAPFQVRTISRIIADSEPNL